MRIKGREREREGNGLGGYERSPEEKERMTWFGHPHDRYTVDPPPERRFAKTGAYITMIRRLPVGGFDKVLPGMMFFARHVEGTDEFGFDAEGYYKVIAETPWGDVHVWPYEYVVFPPSTIYELFSDAELIFHPAKIDPKTMSEQVFYVQSRGIPLSVALPMCLGTMEGRNIGWFEPTPDLQQEVIAMLASTISAGPWLSREGRA